MANFEGYSGGAAPQVKVLQPVDSAWSFSEVTPSHKSELRAESADDVILPVDALAPTHQASDAARELQKVDPFAVITADKNSKEFQDAMKEASEKDSDIFNAAMLGDSARVYYLLENRLASVSDRDAENCTALHWAAVNNQIYVAKTLTMFGADPLEKGGARQMNSLQWAAHAGETAMVMLLLDSCPNALDALNEFDAQGTNCLHLAVQSGRVILVLYLLGRGMDVDSGDVEGRTPLMWACYVGNSKEILPMLLQWNADINATDRSGFTAVHWAVVSQHYQFAAKLIHEGAYYDAADYDNKTPAEWAVEKQTAELWDIYCAPEIKEIEAEQSRSPRKYKKPVYAMLYGGESASPDVAQRRTARKSQRGWNKAGLSQVQTERLLYAAPFVIIPACFEAFVLMPVWVALLIVPLTLYFGSIFAVFPLLRPLRDKQLSDAEKQRVRYESKMHPDNVESSKDNFYVDKNNVNFIESPYSLMDSSPLLGAIFQASLLWTFLTWALKMMVYLPMGGLANTALALSLLLSGAFYYKAALGDPGTLQRPTGDTKQQVRDQVRATVLRLANGGRLHARHYCFTCEIERPLRSKHCKFTRRCIHRFDHYCPWAYNAIGASNHKSFVMFLFAGLVAANLFISIGARHLLTMSALQSSTALESSCPTFAPFRYVCSLYTADRWVFIAVVYVFFQSNWMTLLTVFQAAGIMQDRTTNENMNAHKYDYLKQMDEHNTSKLQNCKQFWLRKETIPNPTNCYDLDMICSPADSQDMAFAKQPDVQEPVLPHDYDDEFVPGGMSSTMKKANSLTKSILTHPRNPLHKLFVKFKYSQV